MIEYPADYEKKLKEDGYRLEENILKEKPHPFDKQKTYLEYSSDFYKNTYYPEVSKMLFIDDNKESLVKIYQKPQDYILIFFKGKEEVNVKLAVSEIFLFPEKNRLGMFSLQLELENDRTDIDVSNINFLARSFNSKMKVKNEKEENKWINWIEKNILSDLKISGKEVKVDDYSGSKFKIFTVIDTTDRQTHLDRCHMLYDIGSGVPIGSASGIGGFAPSKNYYNQLMKDKISVFKNWDALALFDSFTVVGNNLFPDSTAEESYTTTYFRVYIFNLFFKFNLFRFKTILHEETLAVRNEFENFVNTYNISQVSFNFLPNLIYHTQRKALIINSELKKFNERITRISMGIQERQQRRTNALLTFVSIVASAGSVIPIYNNLEEIKTYLGWTTNTFYTILVILILIGGFFLFKYIFSETYKTLSRKIKKINSSTA